ncbi:cytochrome c-552 precursor [Paramagnetospirillum marisnigri]|uniref:Cytochrome c-552 n=1 Tax=Paramagnetospirillum marisnigri TaxID=1285242 RepID=A0A178MN03_9PROT|nr:c-type cytochrome [Paramagnetospirillum marisnigri]OAN49923.1 cytochrome c-552 precursor [Paramagnetospirillum marisnigri]
MKHGLSATLALLALACGIGLGAPGDAQAQQQPPFSGVMIKGQPYVYDAENAKDVMRICAGCHGELGAGGGGGAYPRLGGLNADYLAEQFKKFKTRERENIPMIPFAVDREMSESDVLDVSRYLSEVKLDTKPPADLPKDGYARLQIMKKVLQIPHEPGDIEAGKAFFAADCAACHGRKGEGRVKKPPLAGQHIAYLKTQVDNFLTGKRHHDDLDILRARTATDWTNLWAYLSSLLD